MWLKKAITLCCFLVLSFQLLPVRQLGSLLFKNGLTEELPHDDCTSKECKDGFFYKKDFTFSNHSFNLSFITATATQYIHFAAALPTHFAGDIHTPPPNSLA